MKKVRVRFAPSPTGQIHIGNMRTALFDWLYARNQKGTLILRIEDTDVQRSTAEFEELIYKEMEWLGLDVDEGPGVGGEFGPYRQSERLDLYREHAERLLEEGKAYRCYCTPEELDEMRQEFLERGQMPRYPGRCRNLTAEEEERFQAEGRKPVIRFKLPEEERAIKFRDIIRGELEFKSDVLDDFVILKSDGMPTYNFAVVIDDHYMKVTHVTRGEDHISNTPKQILLYEAFGWETPEFAHMPLILDKNRAKLKKRSNDDYVYVGEFREKGYLPEALFNYLALLGWSPGGDEEVLSREEIVAQFSLDRVNKSAAIFDLEKLNWLNGIYIRKKSPEELLPLVQPYLEKAGYISPPLSDKERKRLLLIVEAVQESLNTLSDIVAESELFFKELEFEDIEKAREEFQQEGVRDVFRTILAKIEEQEELTPDSSARIFKGVIKELPVGGRTVYHPSRFALTGRGTGPELNYVMAILGRDEVRNRLLKALEIADES